ncbi:MAG TPA: AraC family transcriptional regulator [Polyangiaceae bacterium]|jgi:AraC family transcriptional regulator|nr:AraC family transcriptional regulator [Polyangiaceae bacterium]
MIAKYGLPLTDSDWVGLPLRCGNFPGVGKVEGLNAHSDSVLLWGGGASEVTLECGHEASPYGETKRVKFTRTSGMIDLLPQGTVLREVNWVGEAQNCVSVNLPEGTVSALMGKQARGLDPEGEPQFCVFDAHVGDLVRRLQFQAQGGQNLGASYVQSLSLTLATYVSARYGVDRPEPTPARHWPKLPADALATFVDENLASDIGLVDLANLTGFSPDYFAKLFKRAFGVSPHQYLITRRIERAKAMLSDEGVALSNVAADCGFASQAHLSTVFKRHTGLSPSAYRRSL